MKFSRRSFIKSSSAILAGLLSGKGVRPVQAAALPSIFPGKEVAGRCPLCSLGCGLIYRSRGPGRWSVEGDPDCPVASGSLCSRGAGLIPSSMQPETTRPLYRPPGGHSFTEIGWNEAVHLVARRLKDLRDRDLSLFSTDEEKVSNRFDSLGIIAGGCLTNEEAYLVSKLFRAVGVLGMDTSVRASHGMAVTGLLDTLGLPGATHPVTQMAYSDVVVLAGCNPGQTSPAVCRFLDQVRDRRGIVIVIDPRRSETIKKDDLWLQLRPGTDNAVLGAFMHWVLKHAEISRSDLVEHSDAAFMVLSEIMGEYERHSSGKYKNWKKVDETLSEPYSIFRRMKEHFKRYDLNKVAGITGVDIHLLRRACTSLARTASPDFSATFVLGSGVLASPSGTDAVSMAAGIQALLGNLDKRGGGVILPAAAGNAQGVCDMGLLAPYLPGFIDLPRYKKEIEEPDIQKSFDALVQAWYPSTALKDAKTYFPHLNADENPSVSTIIRSIGDEQLRAFIAIGSDPLSSLPDNSSILKVLARLDLLVVMDCIPNKMSSFWSQYNGRESTIKTEVIFIPTEVPALKNGSMTDSGRRVRSVKPIEPTVHNNPGLLNFIVSLGNSLRSKYEAEGGFFAEPVLELSWPLAQEPEEVAAEINGWSKIKDVEKLLVSGRSWQSGDRCGNHLYRGWIDDEGWLVKQRDSVDPYSVGLYEKWGWFWPWGIAAPFSWIKEPGNERGAYLRWKGQDQKNRLAADVLPVRPQLPVKFWRLVEKGSPFPEHYEPFHSPLPDYLTGGRSNPNLQLRRESDESWGYLSRELDEILIEYPVIITLHRTGNIMGTGGITTRLGHAAELGVCRIIEIGKSLARSLEIVSGDKLVIYSPYSDEGLQATALVTGRIETFQRGGDLHDVASLTLYGNDDSGANTLTPPAFDYLTGGLEIKVFMGRIEKEGRKR